MSTRSPVAVIGAGPYGLSVAAHLRARGVNARVFGQPMHNWRFRMPAGMFLKSEGFASNLSDPRASHTLKRYCEEHGLAYGDIATPTPLSTFTDYGLWFQQRLVPELERTDVSELVEAGQAFELRLTSGEVVRAGQVVVAVGFSYFPYVPSELEGLPDRLVSHASDHRDLSCFRGRDVTVIGAGQSALETAALLREQGAYARVLVRKPAVSWNAVPVPHPRSLAHRIRHPQSGLCDGWICWLYSNAPAVFRRLPVDVRLEKVRTALGPSGSWWLRDRVEHCIPLLTSQSVVRAEADDGVVQLRLLKDGGGQQELTTEHVIAATGYRVDVDRLPFLHPDLRLRIRRVASTPALSPYFESSVAGLYFVGLAAASTFGPVLRFVYGSDFTAGRVSRHIESAQRS
jgi:FAD-dependent urate hydroxylase